MNTNLNYENNNNNIIEHAMQLTTAIAMPMALKAAMELSLLEIIEKAGPHAALSPSEIAAQLVPGACNIEHASQMVDRLLRLLSAYSVVTCSIKGANEEHAGKIIERVYGLGPLSCYFIQSQDGRASLAPLFHMINDKLMTNVWYHMKDAIIEDKVPFNKAYDKSLTNHIANDDQRFAHIFQSAMKDLNILFINKILDVYKGFEGLNSIVDLGGGNCSILRAIISKYPTIKGINFDRPRVIEMLEPYPGIENIAGDFLTSSIPKGDAIFMKWILKNLNGEDCLEVLKKCYEVLPDGGKLMIVELVIQDIPETTIDRRSSYQFDLFLTNVNDYAKERTLGEFQALAMEAGFSTVQATARAYDITLLQFHKINSSAC